MLKEIIGKHDVRTVGKDWVREFGNVHDGAIEFVGRVEMGLIEVGYYYGDSKPKNIVDVSTQVGCPSRCAFCEIGNERFIRDLRPIEIYEQALLMLQQASLCGLDIYQKPHKISFAKTGEPLFNEGFVSALELIADLSFSMKISTIFPEGKKAENCFTASRISRPTIKILCRSRYH